jgi:hypothetical protein
MLESISEARRKLTGALIRKTVDSLEWFSFAGEVYQLALCHWGIMTSCLLRTAEQTPIKLFSNLVISLSRLAGETSQQQLQVSLQQQNQVFAQQKLQLPPFIAESILSATQSTLLPLATTH